jgi:hypothetical protein
MRHQPTSQEAVPIGVLDIDMISWEPKEMAPDTTNDEAQAIFSAFSAQLGT